MSDPMTIPETKPAGDAEVLRLFRNCDDWGAVEWFERLANAVMEQDKAVVAGNELSAETYRMIAASSAMELVRGHRTEIRSALARLSEAPARDAVGAGKVKALEWRSKRHDLTEKFAISAVGTYFAYETGAWTCPTKHHPCETGSMASAKADAQADYEQRILSALTAVRQSCNGENVMEPAPIYAAEIKEYTPAGGEHVMIWVNDRLTAKGGYCLECVPRHVAPTIRSALTAAPAPALVSEPTAEDDDAVNFGPSDIGREIVARKDQLRIRELEATIAGLRSEVIAADADRASWKTRHGLAMKCADAAEAKLETMGRALERIACWEKHGGEKPRVYPVDIAREALRTDQAVGEGT